MWPRWASLASQDKSLPITTCQTILPQLVIAGKIQSDKSIHLTDQITCWQARICQPRPRSNREGVTTTTTTWTQVYQSSARRRVKVVFPWISNQTLYLYKRRDDRSKMISWVEWPRITILLWTTRKKWRCSWIWCLMTELKTGVGR